MTPQDLYLRQHLVHNDNLQDQSQPRRLSTHHPSTEQHQNNDVYTGRGTLRSLSLPLPQTLTRPLRRLWLPKSRHHRKSSICWIQVPDTYHGTQIDTSTNTGWQYQDAEPLEPFSISELAASQARVVYLPYIWEACDIYSAGILALCPGSYIGRHSMAQPYRKGTKYDHLT